MNDFEYYYWLKKKKEQQAQEQLHLRLPVPDFFEPVKEEEHPEEPEESSRVIIIEI